MLNDFPNSQAVFLPVPIQFSLWPLSFQMIITIFSFSTLHLPTSAALSVPHSRSPVGIDL